MVGLVSGVILGGMGADAFEGLEECMLTGPHAICVGGKAFGGCFRVKWGEGTLTIFLVGRGMVMGRHLNCGVTANGPVFGK